MLLCGCRQLNGGTKHTETLFLCFSVYSQFLTQFVLFVATIQCVAPLFLWRNPRKAELEIEFLPV